MRSNHPLPVSFTLHFILWIYIYIIHGRWCWWWWRKEKKEEKRRNFHFTSIIFNWNNENRNWDKEEMRGEASSKKTFFYCLCLLGVYCILLLLLHFLLSSFSSFLACLVFAFAIPIPTIIYTNKISEINICIVCT